MPKSKNPQDSQDFIVEEWLNSITDDGVKIRILREKDDGGWALVDSKKKSAITDEFLLKLNPGNYRLQAIRANGTIITVRSMAIDEKPDSQLAPAVPVDSDNKFIAMMQQNQNQLLSIFMSMMQSNTQVLVAALSGNRGGDPAQLLTAITGAMSNMKNLAGGDELDKVDKVLSIADKLGGGGSKSAGDHLAEMAKEVLPILAGGMAARAALPPAPAAPSSSSPPVPTVSPVPPDMGKTPAEGDAGATPSPAVLQPLIAQLWAKLEAGADRQLDPRSAAGTLLDLEAMNDPAAAVIVEMLVQIPTFEEWQKRVPIQESRRPWFEQLFLAIKAFVKEGENDAADSTGTDQRSADEKN